MRRLRDASIRLALAAWPRPLRDRHRAGLRAALVAAWSAQPGVLSRTALIADALSAGLVERVLAWRARWPRRSQGGVMTDSLSDLRAAWRALTRRPAFSTAVVATLAIGLGASTAMFSVINAALLRPLPWPHDEALALVAEHDSSRRTSGASIPAVGAWSHFADTATLAAYETRQFTFATADGPMRFSGAAVSPGFFDTFGIGPSLGQTFRTDQPLFDPSPKVVLSDWLWRHEFHGDPSVIGRTIQIEQQPYAVAAIMPPGFDYPAESRFWTTLPLDMKRADAPGLRFLDVVVRLKSAGALMRFRSELAAWAVTAEPAAVMGKERPWTVDATPLRDVAIASVRRPLLIVFGCVCLLFVVATANALALTMANDRARAREYAVQAALGAGQGRLLRQRLLEGAILSATGGLLAVGVLALTKNAIVALAGHQIPRLDGLSADLRVMLFVLGATSLTTMLTGLLPGRRIGKTDPQAALTRGGRSVAGSAASRRRFGALVIVECAIAFALAVMATLLTTSYRHLAAVDLGVSSERIGLARISLPQTSRWRGDATRRQFHDALLTRVAGLPGIEQAGLVQNAPFDDTPVGTNASGSDPATAVRAVMQTSSEGYLETVRVHLAQGRAFLRTDDDGSPLVAVINDVLAAEIWPGQAAVGRLVTFQYFGGSKTATIIGVTHAVHYGAMTDAVRPELYLSFRQAVNFPLTLVFRTSGDPLAALPAIRAAVSSVDGTATVTLDHVASLDDQLANRFAQPRFFLTLVAAFAGVAFLLAALGLAGTLMFWITERWRELGIRMALGASQSSIRRLVLGRAAVVVATGAAIGLAVSVAAGRITETMLFEIRATDPTALVIAAAALAAMAFAACAWPAHRLTRVDPVETLRAD